MKNDNNNNSDIIASDIDAAGFDVMNEPLIPAHIVCPVTPSIPSTSNAILNTSTERTTKEHDATVDDSSSFIDSRVKDDTANYHSIILHHAKENTSNELAQTEKIMLMHIILS